MARSILAGDTNYTNQPLSEMVSDFEEMVGYAKRIPDLYKKRVRHADIPLDLASVFKETTHLANRIIELRGENVRSFKKGYPPVLFIESLKRLGMNANELQRRIGAVWYGTEQGRVKSYAEQYDGDTKRWRLYGGFRDFCIDMCDLALIGQELEQRYLRDGKPIYVVKESGWRVLVELLLKVFSFFK